MKAKAFLDEIRSDPRYAGQVVHIREVSPRMAQYADSRDAVPERIQALLRNLGIGRLYVHQAEALRLVRAGRHVLVCTGTASGKSLCYSLPVIEALLAEPDARALLLFPTKALCQDQFKNFSRLLDAAGLSGRLAGVYDGDTPPTLRRKLRDRASVIFSNPDLLHAGILPQHPRWAEFLGKLRIVVLDELHVYSGIFGSNMALLLRRFSRVCRHYGADPQVMACSATIANPSELAERLTGRPMECVRRDGSPRGRRFHVFWNPPRVRDGSWRSRRSANVEAHELMARLLARGVPTIVFSKARVTAEMIYRYVCDTLRATAPGLVSKVTCYRGGYLPEERREIEARLFNGELMGVSATPALELGIDVGNLEAGILVGYPGTRASYLQQTGRAGRQAEDAVVFLIGLDTSINQYIMSHPEYLFDACVEEAVIDPDNPFVVMSHLRCAAHELAVSDAEVRAFGPHAGTAIRVLADNRKVRKIGERWHYASAETPQHEISLRSASNANVLIQDADTGAVLGEVDRVDAPPLVHPQAIYLHRGDTYLVLSLDLERNVATVKRVDVDYYTQPLGGTDVHHIDHQLREKPLGTGSVRWGEVTAYAQTRAFEKIRFYTLDAVSVHGVDLPTLVLETMAVWLVPPEALMDRVRRAGLDAHSGLRGIGYATRMLLPLFMTCDTLDFSHTVGSVNSPWNAIFIYERYPLGLGFTQKVYELMGRILPRVLEQVSGCECAEGCPCCVGKPLRAYTTWNVERSEAAIPSKAAAVMILEGLLGDRSGLAHPDTDAGGGSAAADELRLEQALRRRLERMGEPEVFHPILPRPNVQTGYPAVEKEADLAPADVARRSIRRRAFDRDLHKRIAGKLDSGGLSPLSPRPARPPGMKTPHGNLSPLAFPGRPAAERSEGDVAVPDAPVPAGDALAARARKRYKEKKRPAE